MVVICWSEAEGAEGVGRAANDIRGAALDVTGATGVRRRDDDA